MAEKKIDKNFKKNCWEDEEVDWPTVLYEDCPCLWDIADWNYAKGDVQKKQYEISYELCIDTSIKKSKMVPSQSTTWEGTGKRKQM